MNWANLIDLYGYGIFDGITIPDGVDREILVNTIMDKCRLAEPMYTDEAFLIRKINNFFNKNARVFENLYKAAMAEYDPLYNYNRYEESSDNRATGKNDLIQVSPYDTGEFVNDSKTGTTEQSDNIHNRHIYGNIGVTTSAQMLEQELKLWPKLNIYEIIRNMFYTDFCLFIY
jgi:hypothetical protein